MVIEIQVLRLKLPACRPVGDWEGLRAENRRNPGCLIYCLGWALTIQLEKA